MASRNRVFLALVASLVFPAALSAGLQKAKDDLAVTTPGHSVWINVLANDGALGGDLRLLKAFKPEHGSVSIENGGVRYTPDAGFEGSESFRYMAQAAKSQPGDATVNVEVGPGGVALTLRGRVVDDPLPGALVTASVGGFEFEAHADAQGNYTLDIAALRGDAFVTLVATGQTASGVTAKFYSVVGEIARLSALAGTDGILVRDENNQVQVTNLSTAQFALLAEANGGEPVDNDQELLTLIDSISLVRLLELAAVVKLVVDGDEALPPGSSDLLALISDPAAVDSFKAGLDAGTLDAAIAEVEADGEVTNRYRVGAMPTNGYTLVLPSRTGTIQPFAGVARMMEFPGVRSGITSGEGGDYNLKVDRDNRMHWELEAGTGDIVVTPYVPYVLTDQLVLATGGGACTDMGWYATDTPVNTRLHRLQQGFGVDYVELTDTIHRHFTGADDPDNCPAPADTDVLDSTLRLGFRLFRGEVPYADTEALGQYALSYYVPAELRWGAAVFDFGSTTGSGAGTVPSAGLSFTWVVDAGHLVLHMSDGVEYEFWRFQSDGRKGEGVLSIAVLPDSRAAVSYNLAARLDATAADFGAVSLPGTWHSGYSISQFPHEGHSIFDFFLVLNGDAEHTGYQHSVDGIIVDDHVRITWGHEGTNFVATGFFDQTQPPGQHQVSSCVPSPTCWPTRRREWIPLSTDGNRYYMIETVSFPAVPGAPGPLIIGDGGQRLNFWEKLPP